MFDDAAEIVIMLRSIQARSEADLYKNHIRSGSARKLSELAQLSTGEARQKQVFLREKRGTRLRMVVQL